MGSAINSLEWLNTNTLRAYPIKENSTRYDLTASYNLVDDFLVDFVFVIDDHKERRFFMRYLSVLGEVIIVQIYDEDNEPAAIATIDGSLHTQYKAYPVTGVKDYSGSLGKLVIGEVAGLLRNPQGLFEFDLAGAEFEPSTIVPDIRGVTSISKFSEVDGVTYPELRGHVLIGEGINTQVRIDEDANLIRIDAIEGAGLGVQCDCPDEKIFPNCIAFINGIPPDAGFNFNIRGVGCIAVNSEGNSIIISNTCATPCCDCDELASLEARIAALEGP